MINSTQFLSASTLNGDNVCNQQGETLGDLKDIMIDTRSGKVAYGVLAFGGVFGMGEKLFAVPWSALSVDGDNKQLLLNVSKDRLKDAPGFDKNNWPNFADPVFTQQISAYYG